MLFGHEQYPYSNLHDMNLDWMLHYIKKQEKSLELLPKMVKCEVARYIKTHNLDAFYLHEQGTASSEWVVNHNLHKRPSVTVVDTGGNKVMGEVEYLSDDELVIRFSSPFVGFAYMN